MEPLKELLDSVQHTENANNEEPPAEDQLPALLPPEERNSVEQNPVAPFEAPPSIEPEADANSLPPIDENISNDLPSIENSDEHNIDDMEQ